MQLIRKVIIPVAGFGTRFLPVTKSQPKEMLPIVDKPVIQYLVEEAVSSGITDIIIITGRGKRSIEDHFDHSFELEYNLKQKNKLELLESIQNLEKLANFIYIRQPKPQGDGHAILCAKDIIGNEPFAVLFGDDIIDSDTPALKQLIQTYQQQQSSIIGVIPIPIEEVSNYGIVDTVNHSAGLASRAPLQISSLIEKPSQSQAPSNLAIIGKYICTPEIFTALENCPPSNDNEIRLINGFQTLIKTQPIWASPLSGNRFDCGSKIGLLKANIHFALKHPDLADELKSYLKTI